MKIGLKLVLLVSLYLTLVSCNVISSYYNVVAANYNFEKGEYQQANYRYLQSLGQVEDKNFILYNLGNVYHDLGAFDSAMDQWDKVDSSDNRDLRFKIAFNRGVLYYGRGDYNTAFSSFREALLIQPEHRKKSNLLVTKQNLEICLQKLKIETVAHPIQGEKKIRKKNKVLSYETDSMLEYVKKKEQLNWLEANVSQQISGEDF